jgi:hypothetical protein
MWALWGIDRIVVLVWDVKMGRKEEKAQSGEVRPVDERDDEVALLGTLKVSIASDRGAREAWRETGTRFILQILK